MSKWWLLGKLFPFVTALYAKLLYCIKLYSYYLRIKHNKNDWCINTWDIYKINYLYWEFRRKMCLIWKCHNANNLEKVLSSFSNISLILEWNKNQTCFDLVLCHMRFKPNSLFKQHLAIRVHVSVCVWVQYLTVTVCVI